MQRHNRGHYDQPFGSLGSAIATASGNFTSFRHVDVLAGLHLNKQQIASLRKRLRENN